MCSITTYIQKFCRNGGGVYGRNKIISYNLSIILRINRNNYHKYCLNYNFGYYFEQIEKTTHLLGRAMCRLSYQKCGNCISAGSISYFYYNMIFQKVNDFLKSPASSIIHISAIIVNYIIIIRNSCISIFCTTSINIIVIVIIVIILK